MNDSITTSSSAWIVQRLPHRTEADQGPQREGVHTTTESEQFVWMHYYQRHPLGGADSESNQLCVLQPMKIIFQTTFVLQKFLSLHPRALQLHRIGSLHLL
jgi:hypothetical protein